MVDVLLNISILIWGVSSFISSYMGGKYLNYLKTQHTDVWNRLGRPGYIYETTFEARKAIRDFEKRKDYLQLSDSELTRRIILNRAWYNIMLFWFIIVLILLLCHYLKIGK